MADSHTSCAEYSVKRLREITNILRTVAMLREEFVNTKILTMTPPAF